MWLLVPLENLPRICHRYVNSGQGRPELALSWELVAPSAGHFWGNTIRAYLALLFSYNASIYRASPVCQVLIVFASAAK